MNTKLITACILSFSLSACSGDGKTTTNTGSQKNDVPIATTSAQDTNTVAVVNGQAISKDAFESYLKQRQAKFPPGTSRQRILDEMINFELVVQDALARNLDKTPETTSELELQRRNILVGAAFREYVKNNPLSDEQMRKDYEARIDDLTRIEYRLRHILGKDEADAKKVLTELDKGGNFIKLAKKYSTGPSAADGGDLGWQSETDVIPEIREKAKTLKKGEHAKEVVKTRFGWHVVYMDDRRETPPPAFDKVKDRVRDVLQRRQVEEYIGSLRTTAKVDINKPAEVKPKPQSKALQPTGKPDIMMNNY